MMRIFGGLVRTNSRRSRVSSLGDGHAHTDVAPFLLLHLDLADPGDPKTPITVEAAVEQLLGFCILVSAQSPNIRDEGNRKNFKP